MKQTPRIIRIAHLIDYIARMTENKPLTAETRNDIAAAVRFAIRDSLITTEEGVDLVIEYTTY